MKKFKTIGPTIWQQQQANKLLLNYKIATIFIIKILKEVET